jgi:hypothetical protein
MLKYFSIFCNIAKTIWECALVGDFNAKTGFFLKIFSEPYATFLNVMDVNVEDGLFRYHIAMTTKIYLIININKFNQIFYIQQQYLQNYA